MRTASVSVPLPREIGCPDPRIGDAALKAITDAIAQAVREGIRPKRITIQTIVLDNGSCEIAAHVCDPAAVPPGSGTFNGA